MRRLGIIGGLGPLASALFYELLIEECYLHRQSAPDLLLINHPFTNGLSPKGIAEGDTNEALIRKGFFRCLDILIQNNIEIAVMVCNTMHIYLDFMPHNAPDFFHVPQMVMEEAFSQGHKKILVLGSRITHAAGLYSHQHVKTFFPSSKDQEVVDQAIEHVIHGKILESDSLALSALIKRLGEEEDFDAVVFACTDIPLIHHSFPLQTDKPLMDSISVPAKIIARVL